MKAVGRGDAVIEGMSVENEITESINEKEHRSPISSNQVIQTTKRDGNTLEAVGRASSLKTEAKPKGKRVRFMIDRNEAKGLNFTIDPNGRFGAESGPRQPLEHGDPHRLKSSIRQKVS